MVTGKGLPSCGSSYRICAKVRPGHDVKLPAPRIPGQQSVSWSLGCNIKCAKSDRRHTSAIAGRVRRIECRGPREAPDPLHSGPPCKPQPRGATFLVGRDGNPGQVTALASAEC